MKTPEELANNTEAYVTCHGGLVEGDSGCGTQPLTASEYKHQLSMPNRGWHCPRCGNSADYNDTESERVQGIYDEVEGSPDNGPVGMLDLIPAPVLDEIGIERERQKIVEGYSEAHDDEHDEGELARAAAVFALYAVSAEGKVVESFWPFEEAIKAKDHRSNLIRAAALLVAEIERLDRKAAREAAKVNS